MNDKIEAWLILLTIVGAITGAYLLAWRGKLPTSRRWASWTIALVSGLGAVVATPYVIEGLEDFQDPAVSFWTALIGTLIMLTICVGAWAIAIRFTIISLRKGSSH